MAETRPAPEPLDPGTVRAAAAGDLGAFETLVRAYQGPVFRFLLRYVGDDALAEDVAQEVFLRVHRNLDGFAGRSKLTTWIFQIARNAAIDAMRSRARRDRLVDDLSGTTLVASPDRTARVELAEALAALRDELRDALLLVEVSGFTYREAGELLGTPEGTVKSRVFHARRRLLAWLSEEGHSHVV